MVKMRVRKAMGYVAIVSTVGLFLYGGLSAEDQTKPEVDAAVARTRKTVRMLDDVYKSAIVLITDKYVNTPSDLPAGNAFKALFSEMKKKGWHEVRLIDATGEPLEGGNAPRDDFEKEAIKKLLAGETYVEKIITKDNKPYLRAATAIPVVMQKCVSCHPHYADAKKGQAIGALGYTLPIE